DGYRRLLAARRAQSAFHPGSPQAIVDVGPSAFVARRGPRDGQTVWAIHNVTAAPLSIEPTTLEIDATARMVDVVSQGSLDPTRPISLGPYCVRWLSVRS